MSDSYIGEIKLFGGNFAPLGFAFCDGSLLPISEYTALFSLIGTTYGGDGQESFALPDLRGRVPVSLGQGPGLSNASLGESMGSETVTLSTLQIPLHTHAQQASTVPASAAFGPGGAPASSATAPIYAPGSPQVDLAPAMVQPTGGGQAHDNMAPFLALNFIIALEGIFPQRN